MFLSVTAWLHISFPGSAHTVPTPMKLSLIIASIGAVAHAVSIGAVSDSNDDIPNRLVKVSPLSFIQVSENDKLRMRRKGIKFMDITNQLLPDERNLYLLDSKYVWAADHPLPVFRLSAGPKVPLYNYPTNASHESIVKSLIEKIDLGSVKANLGQFSSFFTRYYKSESGFESANWLHGTVTGLVAKLPKELVEITKVHHDGWDQYSIIVSIKGESADKVVVGAHQDSINLLFPNLLRSPGADDDGSGTVTTLESLRLVVEAIASGDFTPYNTLEFHYYSAEEGGLLGSVDVFSKYYSEKRKVVGMLQQDMTGYTKGTLDEGVEPHFGLINDYTSEGLNGFIKVIVDSYCAIPYHETQCGYACSDHASALENGYPASFLIESEFKYTAKQIHLTLDTMDRLDFDHIREHIKLTVGFAIELSAATNL